jgi:hypothetical protein
MRKIFNFRHIHVLSIFGLFFLIQSCAAKVDGLSQQEVDALLKEQAQANGPEEIKVEILLNEEKKESATNLETAPVTNGRYVDAFGRPCADPNNELLSCTIIDEQAGNVGGITGGPGYGGPGYGGPGYGGPDLGPIAGGYPHAPIGAGWYGEGTYPFFTEDVIVSDDDDDGDDDDGDDDGDDDEDIDDDDI